MHMAQNNFRSCYCIKMNANLVFAFLDDFLEISQPVLAGAMFAKDLFPKFTSTNRTCCLCAFSDATNGVI